ncbi:virginiamycin B lyase, partial [Micromonospora tulbaghiae]|nr:virginiamycin B lyase [Micromonospora tulbaghiae]
MTQPVIREIPLTGPGSGPYSITVGPDGALWLTLAGSGGVARLGLDGEARTYRDDPPGSRPLIIAGGPDGA